MDVTYVVEFADGSSLFALDSVETAREEIDKKRRVGNMRAFPARILEVGPNSAGTGRVIETVAQ
jgi:hypothetical protein